MVDQTVDEVANKIHTWLTDNSDSEITEALRKLSGTDVPLVVARLRGEMRDDHAWSDNPEVPAIIVGTADMIGSRLLCRGYGESKYHQPKSAGFLGVDNLIVNDEAHLTLTFAKLILDIEKRLKPGEPIGFPMRAMLVSATNMATARPFAHDLAVKDAKEDGRFAEVFRAKKSVSFRQSDDLVASIVNDALAAEDRKTVIFVTTPEDALAIVKRLSEIHKGRVALITGEMRGYERQRNAGDEVFSVFRTTAEPAERYFLVMTSAGEVGLNIDASLCLSELNNIASLSQRFGRLNRFGKFAESRAFVYVSAKKKRAKADPERDAILASTIAFIETLPRTADRGYDVSPQSLFGHPAPAEAKEAPPLTARLDERKLHLLFCSSAPAIEREGDEALTMVADMVHNLIHGKERFMPTTTFACRFEVPYLFDCKDDTLMKQAVSAFRVLGHEEISMPHDKAAEKIKRMSAATKLIIFASDHLRRCTADDFNGFRGEYKRWLLYESLILIEPGSELLRHGMLDPGHGADPLTDVADWGAERGRFLLIQDEEGNETIEALGTPGIPEPDRAKATLIPLSATTILLLNKPHNEGYPHRNELLDEHQQNASMIARQCADRLLPHLQVSDLLADVLLHHDDGKAARIWQAAAHGNTSKPLAKSARFTQQVLAGFRHELKSAALQSRRGLADKLAIHHIAAHHGHGRPFFKLAAVDPDDEEMCGKVMEVVLDSFYDLNKQWGYWGLAYLEGCVKCWDAMSESSDKA